MYIYIYIHAYIVYCIALYLVCPASTQDVQSNHIGLQSPARPPAGQNCKAMASVKSYRDQL